MSHLSQLRKTVQHWEYIMGGVIGAGNTPEELLQKAIIYFQRCDDNPIYRNEVIRSGKRTGEVIQIPVQRPYTIQGLCLHLGITRDYLLNVSNSDEKNDFYFVAKTIIEIIQTQQLEGAMTGIYNPIIGSKILGLNNTQPNTPTKTSINIEVITSENQKLISNEQDIDLPKTKKV
jgi:hypothetical protein